MFLTYQKDLSVPSMIGENIPVNGWEILYLEGNAVLKNKEHGGRITISNSNLLYLLKNGVFEKGIYQGECIVAKDRNYHLVPVNSEWYQEILNNGVNNLKLTPKGIYKVKYRVGREFKTETMTYLGRYYLARISFYVKNKELYCINKIQARAPINHRKQFFFEINGNLVIFYGRKDFHLLEKEGFDNDLTQGEIENFISTTLLNKFKENLNLSVETDYYPFFYPTKNNNLTYKDLIKVVEQFNLAKVM